jgi:hypothetical protein
MITLCGHTLARETAMAKVVDFQTHRAALVVLASKSKGPAIDKRLIDSYENGVEVGDHAGRDFRDKCALGDSEAAAKYALTLKITMNDLVDQLIADGVDGDCQEAWVGGFTIALVPHAIAWNYGPLIDE